MQSASEDSMLSDGWRVGESVLEPGLYVVATPIGNLEDISLRALRVLRQADWIAAEDTRSTQHLLRAYGIQQPLISLHRDNEEHRIPQLIDALAEGKRVALVSEAGTPCISDPGFLTIQAVIQAGHPVVPIPGASAVIAALCVAGLPSHHFVFLGFLPQRRGKRRQILNIYRHLPATLVLYASPHHVQELLLELLEILGDRQACIGRELTKKFEELLRGSLSELVGVLQQRDQMRGEFVVLVEGISAQDAPRTEGEEEAMQEAMIREARQLLVQGGKPTKLAQQLAQQFPSLSRQQAYQLLQQLADGDPVPDSFEPTP